LDKYYPIQHTIHQWKVNLFSFRIMYKFQFKKKLTHVTGFVVQGHILYMLNLSVGYFFSVWNLQLYKMFYITY